MREIYLETLKNAMNDFNYSIRKEDLFKATEIYHLLTFVGLSKIREYENSNIENSCSLFPSLKKLTMFCTDESLNNAISLKNKLLKPDFEIQIIIMDANISNRNLYHNILKVINYQDFDSIFFDTTQGMKTISIAFYKLGVELGIKSLNWVSTHSLKDDYNLFRCIDSLRIDFLTNPKNENYKFFKLLNDSIDNYDFKGVANLYKSINDNEKSFLFESLSRLFDDSCIDINFFKNNLKEFIFSFSKLSSFSQKRFKEVFNIFNFFLNEAESDTSIVSFDSLSEFGFVDSVTEDEVEYLYNYLFIPFLLKKIKNINIREFIFSKYLSWCFNNRTVDYTIDNPSFYFDILNNFFHMRQVEVFKNTLNFTNLLKEKRVDFINFSMNRIEIEGYEIIFSNKFISNFFGRDLKSFVLRSLINNKNKEVFMMEIIDLIDKLEIKNISKAFSDLEKNFKLLNIELNNLFLEEKLEYRDIIKYVSNKETRLTNYKSIILNQYYSPKIYINI